MYLLIEPATKLLGTTTLPGSKSQAVRALVIALLARGTSYITNLPKNEDVATAIKVISQLSAEVTVIDSETVKIKSTGTPHFIDSAQLKTGDSGITTRFILPILGLREKKAPPIVVDTGAQMRQRPIAPLVNALRQLGMKIDYLEEEGRFPLHISGKLEGGPIFLEGLTSQYLSALLIALPRTTESSSITVTQLRERPYITMTLEWLQRSGINYQQKHLKEADKDIFQLQGNQTWTPHDTKLQGDFSSAAPLLAAAALLPGKVTLKGLDFNDPQADKRLVTLLQEMGAIIKVDPAAHSITIEGGTPLKGTTIDASNTPDLLPILAVLGTQAQGITKIVNVPQARIKETDRIHAITTNLSQMGAQLKEYRDGITLYQSQLKGCLHLQSYGDHRTVMALTVAALIATGKTKIMGAEALDKTFPQFTSTLKSLGAPLSLDP